MPIDASLAGREFPPTAPHRVTADSVGAFAASLGVPFDGSSPVPPTYPIVVTFAALQDFLAAEQVDLSRIVHGDQRFSYVRPVAVGDELTATMRVAKVRSIGGNDIITTTSDVTDAAGELVVTAAATLVHRGEVAA
ncbi:MaoC family dehydratase N-terminal domain-containing protein [Nocardioides sp. zg-536]|uniref:MaoC family dehydratase N-terminal domain-containing protein n=1 Tax=Nocardioides faecalis TaxID=2803858 RepID=A0A939BWE9_9ACTN|nr:MaoC family dehydratase N-terminal domain-containing protein [Nocardioides faecalis]MBM9460961.1 MaoC family dehydratase N-terminal domain-containing protein [Nocardioides faecalis]MBS4751952.1 MaoC family dehydratase N-terminal domain-containing protein [Nocardioides faecalis]QVI59216.1 MaoC family dehydratase N-terminal domain-containing protein [Nocardioides faecalis]